MREQMSRKEHNKKWDLTPETTTEIVKRLTGFSRELQPYEGLETMIHEMTPERAIELSTQLQAKVLGHDMLEEFKTAMKEVG